MLRDQAMDQIKAGLGFRTGTELDQYIVNALQRAQRLEEQGTDLPWFLERTATVNVAPGGTTAPLRTDFIREIPFRPAFYLVDGRPVELKRRNPLDIRHWPANSYRLAYTITPTQLVVAPATRDGLSLSLSYWGKDTILTTNIENGWLREAPEILVGAAGSMVASYLGYAQGVAIFDRIYTAAKSALLRETVAKQADADVVVMGSEVGYAY